MHLSMKVKKFKLLERRIKMQSAHSMFFHYFFLIIILKIINTVEINPTYVDEQIDTH